MTSSTLRNGNNESHNSMSKVQENIHVIREYKCKRQGFHNE